MIRAGSKDAERARGQREAYWALFKAHLDDALVERIREATNGNYALGDRRFQAEMEQALDGRVTKGKAGRPKTQPEHRRGQLGLLWNRGLSPITQCRKRVPNGKLTIDHLAVLHILRVEYCTPGQ